MKLSIIIPVFNEINYIEEFTNNLKNTFVNENVEYIFINDGSNDGSGSWLENYIKKQPEKKPHRIAQLLFLHAARLRFRHLEGR